MTAAHLAEIESATARFREGVFSFTHLSAGALLSLPAPVVLFSKYPLDMKEFLRTGIRLAILGLLLGFSLNSQAQSPPQVAAADTDAPLAIVHAVRPLSNSDGSGIEILANRPIVPTIRKAENPPRLVIDLPDTRLAMKNKRIAVRSAYIEDVRVDQFQEYPPIARIVIDLLRPLTYSWDADGDRLSIHLRSAVSPASPVATIERSAGSAASSATLKDVTLDGNRVDAGSSVTAGSDAAVLQLGRGGQVRVCPKTTVSVTPSKNGQSLMLGMSTGAMEAHYSLGPSADSILTPDFRIQLVGPGEFDYAISADARGNTCVQALPGNAASVIISELLGDGTYQVKPSDHVLFHSGQLKNVAFDEVANCGCSAPERPVVLASSKSPDSAATLPGTSVPAPAATVESSPRAAQQPGSEMAALPPSNPKEVHIQVDAPFVFRGDDPAPPPIVAVGILPLRSPAAAQPAETTVVAPPAKEHHGFFGKLRGFFAAVFG